MMQHVGFPLQSHHFYPLSSHEGVEVNQLIGNLLMRQEDETFTAASEAASVVLNTVSVVQTQPYLELFLKEAQFISGKYQAHDPQFALLAFIVNSGYQESFQWPFPNNNTLVPMSTAALCHTANNTERFVNSRKLWSDIEFFFIRK